MKKSLLTTIVLLILCVSSASMAFQYPTGVRAGYTSWNSVEQLHVGAHTRLGELFPAIDLTPGIEIGFGSDATFVTVNGDLAYQFTELTTAPWGLYGGGSLSYNYFDFKHGSDSHLGLSALAGITHDLNNGNEVMAEVRLGILDSPAVKVTVGYTFF